MGGARAELRQLAHCLTSREILVVLRKRYTDVPDCERAIRRIDRGRDAESGPDERLRLLFCLVDDL